MNCDQYKKWDLGELDLKTFDTHAQNCAECQRHLNEDKKLLTLAQSLKEPIEAPQLWDRIARDIKSEQTEPTTVPFIQSPTAKWLAAAILIVGLGLGYLLSQQNTKPSGLLSYEALTQVEKAEQDYIASIEQLEQNARPALEKLDPKLNDLYLDKLAIINRQIAQCQEAIEENPANAHVRRYLLAALQKKKNTLQGIITHNTNVQ